MIKYKELWDTYPEPKIGIGAFRRRIILGATPDKAISSTLDPRFPDSNNDFWRGYTGIKCCITSFHIRFKYGCSRETAILEPDEYNKLKMKVCKTCNISKPVSDCFYKNSETKCKICFDSKEDDIIENEYILSDKDEKAKEKLYNRYYNDPQTQKNIEIFKSLGLDYKEGGTWKVAYFLYSRGYCKSLLEKIFKINIIGSRPSYEMGNL